MRSIYITSENHRRPQELQILIYSSHDRDCDDLEAELNRAQVVPPQAVPPDVVTMHSQAYILDLVTGEEMLFRRVFPEEAN